mmetsp:Transcript_12697/g.12534  ORF Transcript_12697/g.12534 Transcript_12697/m.12534 type:complete len:157 (+) Transcript_12697:219-689(+)
MLGDVGIHIFEYITHAGNDILGLTVIAVAYSLFSRPISLLVTLFVEFNLILNCVLKEWYKAPRPVYSHIDTLVSYCSTSFGHPSGHAASGTTYFLIIYMLIRLGIKPKYFADWLVYIICWLFILLCGTSRMVMGVHTLDQVFYSLVLMSALHLICW